MGELNNVPVAINVIDEAADVYYDNLRSLTRVLGRVSLEDLSDIFRKAVVPAIEKVRELDRAGRSANPLHGVVDRQCEEIESLRQQVKELEAERSRLVNAVTHYITVANDPDLPDDDMQRYEDAMNSLADVVGGKPPRVDGSGYTLKDDYWCLVETLRECDQYLKQNSKNAIGSDSMLHQKIQAALQQENPK